MNRKKKKKKVCLMQPFVTTQHEWVTNFPCFFGRTLMRK